MGRVRRAKHEIALWFPEGLTQYKLANEVCCRRCSLFARERSLMASSLFAGLDLRVNAFSVHNTIWHS
jgi:hypothetical protein